MSPGPILAGTGILIALLHYNPSLGDLLGMESSSGSARATTGQDAYVQQFVAAAKDQGLPRDAAEIAVAAGLVESNLRNLANPAVPASLSRPNDGLGYDHDSVGVLQQRDNGAWGSLSDRMDPYGAATMFYLALPPGWENDDPGDVAQSVQRSAYPGRYATRMDEASALVGEHW